MNCVGAHRCKFIFEMMKKLDGKVLHESFASYKTCSIQADIFKLLENGFSFA